MLPAPLRRQAARHRGCDNDGLRKELLERGVQLCIRRPGTPKARMACGLGQNAPLALSPHRACLRPTGDCRRVAGRHDRCAHAFPFDGPRRRHRNVRPAIMRPHALVARPFPRRIGVGSVCGPEPQAWETSRGGAYDDIRGVRRQQARACDGHCRRQLARGCAVMRNDPEPVRGGAQAGRAGMGCIGGSSRRATHALVVAPSPIPSKASGHIKTDRRDATMLAPL